MAALDSIIRSTRKFANKKNVKLDKNSVIEHAIAYIKELQQVNEIYEKRLEESMTQIKSLREIISNYACMIRIVDLRKGNMNVSPFLPRSTQTPFPAPPPVYVFATCFHD